VIENEISKIVIGAAIEVHKQLGPGLLESAYAECLSYELQINKLRFDREKPVPVFYKGKKLDCGYKLDFCIKDKVIVELKAIETILPIHEAQILTYLKLTGIKLGLLINFNVPILRDGIKRIVLNL
jgi:GxxExxY protein